MRHPGTSLINKLHYVDAIDSSIETDQHIEGALPDSLHYYI